MARLLFLTLALLATPAFAADLPLSSAVPAGFQLDGELGEWTAPPTWTLGPGAQVAGASKVMDARDWSARVWLVLSAEGLTVAGEVTDDKVLFAAAGAPQLASDHVEVWLAFPGLELPELGFGSQWGFVPVPDAATCRSEDVRTDEQYYPVARCEAWFAEQQLRRSLLPKVFVRQYLLAPERVEEAYWNEARGNLPAADQDLLGKRPCCDGARARFVPTATGYRFEAQLPAEHFPATAQVPVREARVLVDFVDNDAGFERQESFLSAAPGRKFGRTSTFPRVRFAAPLRFETEPPYLEQVFAAQLEEQDEGQRHLFVFPEGPVRRLLGWRNVLEGYQYAPEVASPLLLAAEFPGEPVLRWDLPEGALQAYVVVTGWGLAGGVQRARLFVYRGGEPTAPKAELNLEAGCWEDLGEAPGMTRAAPSHFSVFSEPAPSPDVPLRQLALACVTTMSPLGSGACGACPVYPTLVVGLGRDGRAKLLLDTSGGTAGGHDVVFSLLPAGAGFELQAFDEIEGKETVIWSETVRWQDLRARWPQRQPELGFPPRQP